VPSEGSFLSRFTLKFLEVLAAGFATAVSGFLIAHFTGFFPTTTSIPGVKQPLVIQHGFQSGTQGAIQVQPAEPASTAPTPATSVVNAAPLATLPQSNGADQPASSNVTEAKPRAAEVRPRDAAKGAAAQSFEATVRAALAKAGSTYPTSVDASRRQAVAPIDTKRAPAAPRAIEMPTGSIVSAPRPDESAPPAAPVDPSPIAATSPQALTTQNPAAQTSRIQLAPQATLEIKSQPVARVDADQPAQGAAEPPGTYRDGPLSTITKRLRSDKPLPEDQAPRPPMPIGQ
jgi:hypothetical protein